ILPKWAMSAPAYWPLARSLPLAFSPVRAQRTLLVVTTRVRPSCATRSMNWATSASRALGRHPAPSSPRRHLFHKAVPIEREIPDLDDVGVPLYQDLGDIPQLRHELAENLRVRGPVEKEEPLIVEHPSPAALGGQSLSIGQ